MVGAALLLAGQTLPAMAASYYMAPTGSDDAAGTLEKPWKSYRRAQSTLKPGDTLFARGGTYGPSAGAYRDWKVSGTSTAPIVFRNYPGETPVFDGRWTEGEFLEFENISWVTVIGLKIQHFNDKWGNGSIDIYDGSHDILISDSLFYDNGKSEELDHHIYIGGGKPYNITIIRNTFDTSPGGGVHLYHSPNGENIYIYNNYFTNCYYGIVMADLATNVYIYNNTFYNNRDVNISIDDHGSVGVKSIQIMNNISYNSNGAPGLKVGSRDAPAVSEDYNLWYSTDGRPISWQGDRYSVTEFHAATLHAAHSIEADPMFISPGKYQIASTSPAIDRGLTITDLKTDLEGTPRPQGPAYDMGAHEAR
jgi:hypothetical protein